MVQIKITVALLIVASAIGPVVSQSYYAEDSLFAREDHDFDHLLARYYDYGHEQLAKRRHAAIEARGTSKPGLNKPQRPAPGGSRPGPSNSRPPARDIVAEAIKAAKLANAQRVSDNIANDPFFKTRR